MYYYWSSPAQRTTPLETRPQTGYIHAYSLDGTAHHQTVVIQSLSQSVSNPVDILHSGMEAFMCLPTPSGSRLDLNYGLQRRSSRAS